MAGIQVSVLPYQTINVPSVTDNDAFMFPMLARYIDALGWVSGTLMVSVYSTNFSTVTDGPPKFRVVVANTMVSAENPSQMVLPPAGAGSAVATVEFEISTGTLNNAVLYTARIPSPTDTLENPAIGRYLGVFMMVDANGATAMSGGKITLAVDLIGRDA